MALGEVQSDLIPRWFAQKKRLMLAVKQKHRRLNELEAKADRLPAAAAEEVPSGGGRGVFHLLQESLPHCQVGDWMSIKQMECSAAACSEGREDLPQSRPSSPAICSKRCLLAP